MTEALKCPSCSASLEAPPGNATSMRCPYCNSTVMLVSDSQGKVMAAFAGDPEVSGAGKSNGWEKVAELLRAGKKIEAIRLYRELNGVGLATAKTAIDQMAAENPTIVAVPTGGKFAVRFAMGILFFVVLIIILIVHSIRNQAVPPQAASLPPPITVPQLMAEPPGPPPPPPEYADKKVEFGAEGIGAGQFKDARSIAIDGAGKIYVGEFSDGRIQEFDSTGKFLSEWSIGHGIYLTNLAADQQGNLYVVSPGKITRYDAATHMPQTEFQTRVDDNHDFEPEEYTDACAAADGNIYAVAGSHIVVLGSDGKIKNVLKEADKIGEDVSFQRIAVTGEGDIYALDRTKGVFKMASDGRYINRFGGGQGMGPGYVMTAQNLAVDGQGRVFVAGADPAVQVFDADGRYLGFFGGNDVAFGIAINAQNEIFACFRNDNSVRGYVVDKKTDQMP
jgi:DNA-directed RNA polymerase subunit RPC12/RpoP